MPKMCGFAKHFLKDGVLVTDPIYIPFIHKSRPDFRPDDEVCIICRNSMEFMYRVKTKRARELQKSRNSKVSTVSSNSRDSIDSIDRLVVQTPLHKKPREKKDDSSQSISTDQSGYARFGGSNTHSPIASNVELQSRSKRIATNILLESRRQSLNETHKKWGRERNNKTKTDILQENRSVLPVSSTESEKSSVASVKPKKVTFNSVVSIPESTSSRVKLIDRGSDIVFSPTIYYYDPTDRDSLSNQQPSTFAVGAIAKGIVQKQSTAVQMITPISSGIRALVANGTSTNNTHTSDLRSSGSSCMETPTAPTIIGRTDKKVTFNSVVSIPESTSSRVKLINSSSDTVFSTPICGYDRIDRDSLTVRLSQKPSTSAVGAKAKVIVQKQSTAVQVVTPKSRGIRDYFTPLEMNVTSTNNIHTSDLRSPGSSTTIGGTDQAFTFSGKRPLNGNADSGGDTNDDSDDDGPSMSLNYYNPDVRFPQYQPIPKRRPFHHKNDKVMDMYIQGLRGG